jgi:hypothetical protein
MSTRYLIYNRWRLGLDPGYRPTMTDLRLLADGV